jgi:aminoglycoside 3-N-acetyltransferase
VSLVDDLRALGLDDGGRVVVHSSLRAVGHGADEVADALLEVVGPQGLVVVPAFTYDTPSFDPATTPARTGALAEIVRCRPEAVRSHHHSHSVAAIGAGAAELCACHELVAATDLGSPLDRLADVGGLVLLLGVGHTSNTTVHVGEFHARAPYLGIPFSPDWPTAAETRFAGCSRAFGTVERGLRERGAIRDGRVGHAAAQLMSGAMVIDEAVALLRADSTALLCTDPRCYRCSAARML